MSFKIGDKVIIIYGHYYKGYEGIVERVNDVTVRVEFEYLNKTLSKKFKHDQLFNISDYDVDKDKDKQKLIDKFAVSAMNAIIIGMACETRDGDSMYFWGDVLGECNGCDKSNITEKAYDIAYAMYKTREEYKNRSDL
jgi:hypothetical protein